MRFSINIWGSVNLLYINASTKQQCDVWWRQGSKEREQVVWWWWVEFFGTSCSDTIWTPEQASVSLRDWNYGFNLWPAAAVQATSNLADGAFDKLFPLFAPKTSLKSTTERTEDSFLFACHVFFSDCWKMADVGGVPLQGMFHCDQ